MALELYHQGTFIGSVVRSRAGSVYAYDTCGTVVGCYHDIDAAGLALIERVAREPIEVAA